MDERRRRMLSAAIIGLFTASLAFGTVAAPDSARAAVPPVASDQTESTRADTPMSLTLDAVDDDGETLTFTIVDAPAHGSLDDCSAGSCTYTPTPDYSGADSFTWKANDGVDDSNVATFAIEVIPNNPPVAAGDEGSTRADTPMEILLAASDDDGDDLTYAIVDGPGHGTLTGTAPDVTYTPDADYAGADSFTWKANDGFDDSNVATFSITVVPNSVPVASDSDDSTRVDTPLQISLFASDDDNDDLTYTIVDAPGHGTLTGTAPDLTYTPDPAYAGPDSFTWQANDGFDDSNVATFGITVAPNSPPEAFPGSASTLVDTAVQLELNASDPDGDTLTFSIVDPPGHGSLSLCTDNSCTYTPAAGYEGPDSFTWKANDGLENSNVATFSIAVAQNTPPQAVDDEAFTISGAVTIDVLDNDVDPDTANGDTLTIVGSTNPPNGSADCTSQTFCEYTPDAGFNGTDTFQYTITDSAGETDSATVTVTVGCPDLSGAIDGGGIVTGQEWIVCSSPIANMATGFTPSHMSRDGATVGLLTSGNATQADDPDSNHPTIPDANGSNGTTHQGANDVSSLRLDLSIPAGANCLRFDFVFGSEEYPHYVGSFNDAFLAELDVTNWQVAGNDITAPGNFAFDTGGGSVSVNSSFFDPGRVVTNDGTAYNGTTAFLTAQTPVTPGSHQLFLTIFDANDHILDSGVFVDRLVAVQAANPATDCKAGANQPPIALDDTDDDILEDSVDNVIDVLGNDDDPDTGDVIAVVSVTDPPHGTARIESGQVLYTPDPNYNGPDSFDYTISDGRGGTATAHVTLRVLPINDIPIGTDGTALATPGTATNIDVGALVTDVETADTNLTYTITHQPDKGILTGSGPTFGYTPAAGASGTDTFSYTVTDRGDPDNCGAATVTCDASDTSLTKTVVITIANTPPDAIDDTGITTDEDVSLLIDVLTNDTDADGHSLTVTSVSDPAHGTATIESGQVRYAPDPDYHGPDSFTYTISDGHGGTDTATVSITVTSVNDDPHAVDDELTTARNTPGDVNVLANDTDVDGDTLSVTGSTDGAHGTVSCTAAGVCTYTPASGYSGPDSFTYTVSDGNGGTATGTVTVTVSASTLVLTLEPLTASNPLGTEHTVTATLTSGGMPLADISVSFSAVTGPHTGTTGSDVTDAEGKATFRYTGTIAGMDTLRASATVGAESITSNDATKTWLGDHTVTVGILGSGSVTSDPGGIACLPTCVASFADGASVTLTPLAQPGFSFLGWSGDCTGTGPCVVTLDADRSVTARFSAPGCVSYAGFTSTAGLNLVNEAAAVGDVLRLTPARNFTQGQAWLARKVDLNADLVSDFSIRFTEQGGSQGADGMTFAIQNTSATASGVVGGGLGYDGLANSIVVELDTFDNGVGAGDADGNHVSVHTGGSGPNGPSSDTLRGAAHLAPDLEDGAIHRVRVVYEAAATELRIYVDDLATPALTVDIDIAATLSLDAGAAWVGFTSATGGGFENHDVLDWSLCAGTGGEGLAFALAPLSATNSIGTAHTVTATLTDDGSPLTGTSVTFEILDGPHAGTGGVAITDASGDADFVWTGTTAGTDTIRASATVNERVIRSNTATKTWVDNEPPVVDAGADTSGNEGEAVNLDGTVTDPDGPSMTTTWSFAPVSGVDTGAVCNFGDLNAVDTSVTCTDDGTYELTLTADDGANTPVANSLILTVGNALPVVTITAPLDGATTGATVSVSASFTDAGANDTHTCQIDWGDTASTSGTISAGVCSDSHTYTTSGPRVITVTVTDDDGGVGSDTVSIDVQTTAPDCVPSNPPNTLEIRTAPGNLRLDGLPATGQPTFQSNTCLFGFAERKDVTLDRNLNPIAPRATNMAVANPPTRLIPAGTVVDSYLIHGDSLGPSGSSTATLSGSWTFDEPILGVFMGRDNLVVTDALVGLTGTPGLTYEQTLLQRGLEFGSNDVVRVTGPDTIEVTFDFNAMDEIRVLTGVIAPDCVPSNPPNTLEIRTAPGNLRLDGLPATGQPTFQSNTCLFGFAERKDVTLDRNLNPIAPRATNMAVANPPTRLIPAGTVVDSYLIHGDSLGPSGSSTATLSGSWTFDEPILGVFMGRDNLVVTDALVGLTGTPGLTYEQTLLQRGLEFGSNDVVRVTGPDTIEVTFDFNAMDEIRVLTGVIAPDCVPSNPPNTLEIRTAPGNLRLDGLPATGQPTFQSNTCLFGFAERKDVTLDRNLNPIAPRATNMAVANPPTRLIPAGTVVDSYLIHGDSLGPSGSSTATLSGSWTFDEPILGVFMGRDNLVVTDALVGLTGTPGLTYEQTLLQRGLEFGSNDVVRVTGPDTIEVTFDFNAMDEIRVLTGVIAPPTGSITIVKDAAPNDAQDFAFAGLGGFTLDDDTDPTLSNTFTAGGLASGTYDVTETVSADWSLSGIECNDGDGGTTVEGAAVHVDLDPGQNITCTFTNSRDATVTIVKDAVPNAAQQFAFTGSFGPFSLDDDTDPTLPSSRTFTVSGTAFGAKTISETSVAGWSLTSLVCSEGTVTGATASLTVDPGDVIICTFTNTKDATVTIVKDAVPNAAQDFAFTGSFGPFNLDDDTDPTLPASRTFTVSGTSFGAKTVSETVPAGWTLTVLCSEGTVAGDTATVPVDPGDTITCTFTNAKDATVTIVKDAVPNGPQDFPFTGSFGPFSLDDDTDPTLPASRTFTVSGTGFGAKTITETIPALWSLTSLVCSEGTVTGATASLTVDPGDVITCTYTNSRDATVTIVKDAVPNAAQDFPFTGSFGPFSLDDDTDPTLPASRTFTVSGTGFGAKTITETAVVRWELTQISCIGDTEATVSLPTRTVTLDVDPGESIICTYRNTFIDLRPFKTQRNLSQPGSSATTAAIPVQLGDTVRYVIGVNNVGTAAASSTVVTDLVPARLRLTSLGGCLSTGVTATGTTIRCDLGLIPAGQTRSATVEAQAIFECEVAGTRGNDTINFAAGVTNGPNKICGGGGSDDIFGQGGDDRIYGNQPALNTSPIVNLMWVDLDADTNQDPGETAQVTANPAPSTDGRDTIEGGAGDDWIDGQGDNDELHGQDGADEIHGSVGDDTITGDAGIDTITGDEDDDAINGGTGSDLINGGPGADSINGGDQGDNVFGGLGNDTIAGESLASTAPGPDTLRGEDGNDTINGAGANDVITGGNGADTLRGSDGDDEIAGNDGADNIAGGDGVDRITGGEATDVLSGNDGNDTIDGNDGNDVIDGGAGLDMLEGNDGADEIEGGDDSDYVSGGEGNDQLWGGLGSDIVLGGGGNDRMAGDIGKNPEQSRGSPDHMNGGPGRDLMYGQGGSDCSTLLGEGTNANHLSCGAQNRIPFRSPIAPTTYEAQMFGGSDIDRLHGGPGNDRLDGGPAPGGNPLVGGDGANDFCSFGPAPGDPRAPSCEWPSSGTSTINWRSWDWDLF